KRKPRTIHGAFKSGRSKGSVAEADFQHRFDAVRAESIETEGRAAIVGKARLAGVLEAIARADRDIVRDHEVDTDKCLGEPRPVVTVDAVRTERPGRNRERYIRRAAARADIGTEAAHLLAEDDVTADRQVAGVAGDRAA